MLFSDYLRKLLPVTSRTSPLPADSLSGALMVCGAASDVGKSVIVAGLCRLLARRGFSVAPFKAQNMSNNSCVTVDGAEIGRAQYSQALAAGVQPESAMNPVLLKPTAERTSQVVVMGEVVGETDARSYGDQTRVLFPLVLDALEDLRARYDIVICEGAGGAAEINLLDRDIVNLRLAAAADLPALLVGDIERGGVFAALYGTVALLPPALRACVKGFVVNKFRGDPSLLAPGFAELTRRSGVPVFGVLPWDASLRGLDEEDSMNVGVGVTHVPGAASPLPSAMLDVAVVRFPRLSNFTDLDPLQAEPGVRLRYVEWADALGDPDLIILPGTKATVKDLSWLHDTGFAQALLTCARPVIFGICGGFQMLGQTITDEVESRTGQVRGLGLLPVETVFGPVKLTRRTRILAFGEEAMGYEIRHGRSHCLPLQDGTRHLRDGAYHFLAPLAQGRARGGMETAVEKGGREGEGAVFRPVTEKSTGDATGEGAAGGTVDTRDSPLGLVDATERVWGASMHGLLENDAFRSAFLSRVALRAGRSFSPTSVCFAEVRQARYDRMADMIETCLPVAELDRLIESAARRPV